MKKICFITSTRADYGLLKESMRAVDKSKDFKLQLLATGTHLSEQFGLTYKEIEKDGFKINAKIDLGDLIDSRLAIALQTSHILKHVVNELNQLKPDLFVVLGDRYEILGATQAAFFLGIPIMHLHGGEATEGAIDDSIRHSITKLSNYHLTSTQAYRNRVLQLGEDPSKTFYVGSTGLDNLLSPNLLTKEQIQKKINFSFKEKNLLITFHPVTAKEEKVSELINAISDFKNTGQIITLPNSDPGNSSIRKALVDYGASNDNVYLTPSMGQLIYNSTMKIVDLVVGNSSSGIIEAPFSGTRTLNIGNRQKGRVMDLNKVTSVACKSMEIKAAISNLLSDESYSPTPSFLYGDGNFSKKFIDILNSISCFSNNKVFFDISNIT